MQPLSLCPTGFVCLREVEVEEGWEERREGGGGREGGKEAT